MSDPGPQQHSFKLWQEHNEQERNNTELVTLGLLRKIYPRYHVTITNTSKCDLLGFASAGFATAVQENNKFEHATRTYEAPGYRLDKETGVLKDDLHFGCWSYNWNNTDYLVYEAEYMSIFGRIVKPLYVLRPGGLEQRHNAATDALLIAAGQWTKELHSEIYVFDNAEWRKSKELFKSVQGASWDDVILDAGMKASLIGDVQTFFDSQELYRAMGVPWKRGVIFHGVPGNGKTISIKALINSLNTREDPVPSLYIKSLDACAGPKWSIQMIFQKARAMAPCLLIFEDLDSMVTNKVRSYFLNEVDGLESNEGILMIGSTNHLDSLDPAITKRPSRFDRKYHFKLPDEQARAAYCRYWCRKFAGSKKADFPESTCPLIAKMTEDFSFAYLKELFVASLLTLARGTHDEAEDDFAQSAIQSDSGSAAGSEAVVIEKEDRAKEADTTKETGADTTALPAKVKKTLPLVDIPKDLQGNMLLCIIRKQAATLLHEMDNTDTVPGKAKASCDDEESPLYSAGWMIAARPRMAE